METLTRVLNYNADDFFNYIRNIDYGYMDVKGKIHKISPNDDYSKQVVNHMSFLLLIK